MKVLFSDGEHVESLWASCVGPTHFRLDNSPFFAYGISWNDVVEAHPDTDAVLHFARVIAKSGHRTLRLILEPPANKSTESQAILDQLVSLGATYEGLHPGYICVDLAPEKDFDAPVQYLTARNQQWEYADPTYEDLFANGSARD